MTRGLTSEVAKLLWRKWKQENPQWLIKRNRKIGVWRTRQNYSNNPMKILEVRQKISENRRQLFREGKLKSPMSNSETRIKMSETRKKRFKEGKIKPYKYWLGKKKSKETIEKVKSKLKGAHSSIRTEFRVGQFSKEKHFNWNGGTSFEPYTPEFDEQLKNMIRNRDNFTCQLRCSRENGRKLTIHHIDYDKKNCSINNLISLCVSCNTKVNYSRQIWKNYFINKEVEKSWQKRRPLEDTLSDLMSTWQR